MAESHYEEFTGGVAFASFLAILIVAVLYVGAVLSVHFFGVTEPVLFLDSLLVLDIVDPSTSLDCEIARKTCVSPVEASLRAGD